MSLPAQVQAPMFATLNQLLQRVAPSKLGPLSLVGICPHDFDPSSGGLLLAAFGSWRRTWPSY